MTGLNTIARRDIGLCESPRGSNKGPQLQKFFDADNLPEKDGYPWCASAVSYWVQQWIKENPSTRLTPPRIAAVCMFPDWAKKNGLKVRIKAPKAGDIFTLSKASHIGVIDSVLADGSVKTVEGNTNSGGSREGWRVEEKHRQPAELKYFISLGERNGDLQT